MICKDEYYTGQTPLRPIVFLLTDTMTSRKTIFDKHIKLKTDLMIETRMGSNMGMIYTINPKQSTDIRYWQSKWYPDDEAEVSACGSEISVGPTSDILAGYAVWQLINWLTEKETPKKELIFTTQQEQMLLVT